MALNPTDSNSTGLKEARTGKHERWFARSLDTWFLEIFALIFSVSCFLAICAMLLAYSGKTTPELHYGLSLNAIISILATGSKSALLFIIGEALSQLKWVWYRNAPRPLLDMQTFDSASRGPLGSMMMLFYFKRSVATFGAAIVVLLLAFDPFVQQITRYPTRPGPINDGTGIATTRRLTWFGPQTSATEWNLAYLSGIWSDDNLYHPTCSSGNCTWPVFRSVGVCSQCTDVTESVGLECHSLPRDNESFWDYEDSEGQAHYFNASCSITPPLGQSTMANSSFTIGYANQSDQYRNVEFQQDLTWVLYSGFEPNAPYGIIQQLDNATFAGVTNPLMVIGYTRLGYEPDSINASDPTEGFRVDQMTQCSLSLCLGDWQVSVAQGITTTEISNIDHGKMFWISSAATPPVRYLCWTPTSSSFNGYSPGELPDLSSTDYQPCNVHTVQLDQDHFVGASTMLYVWTHGQWLNTTSRAIGKHGNPSTQRIASAGLEHVMSNVANSLNSMALRTDGEEMNGTAYEIEVFVLVQWPWLILPALLVLSGVFFAILALRTNDVVLWKSSVLALLYHGLGEVDTGDYTTASSMEKEAADTRVQLEDFHSDGKLELASKENTATG